MREPREPAWPARAAAGGASTPEAGASWTDSGRREERRLNHRAKGETRIVPCPPALTALLHAHLPEHRTAPDGRLFRGVRGGELQGHG